MIEILKITKMLNQGLDLCWSKPLRAVGSSCRGSWRWMCLFCCSLSYDQVVVVVVVVVSASYGVLRCYGGIIVCYNTAPGVNLTIRSMLWRSTPAEVCSQHRRLQNIREKNTHLHYHQVFGVFSVFPFSCRPTLKLAWGASSLMVRHLFVGNFGNLAYPWW